jgi:hypothetical protein
MPLQPHSPPPLTDLHTLPRLFPAHEAHSAPVEPQAVLLTPVEHTFTLQQPSLHGCVPLQVVVQSLVVLLHA